MNFNVLRQETILAKYLQADHDLQRIISCSCREWRTLFTILGPVDVWQRRFTGHITRKKRRIAFNNPLIFRSLHKLRCSYIISNNTFTPIYCKPLV